MEPEHTIIKFHKKSKLTIGGVREKVELYPMIIDIESNKTNLISFTQFVNAVIENITNERIKFDEKYKTDHNYNNSLEHLGIEKFKLRIKEYYNNPIIHADEEMFFLMGNKEYVQVRFNKIPSIFELFYVHFQLLIKSDYYKEELSKQNHKYKQYYSGEFYFYSTYCGNIKELNTKYCVIFDPVITFNY